MTDQVDNKVVAMKFDNAAFESKLGDTLKSLDKLQKSLDFQNSTKGMNELSAASRNFSMHGVADAVEGVGAKFLAMSTIGITALATLTSKAISAGTRIVSAFTLDPIKQGFQEFETNIGSIQTILANTSSKGTNLKDVNAALDELNTFADQTIYNFSQMTKNIGTFTAAGIGLKESTQSIKGIANLAAISGSNADQASSAMYQLSQALAAGSVKLMDWNSIVNAGMGGEVFQKSLFESGKAMKTLTGVPVGQTFDQWKKAGNTFRGSLESGWLTAEVLTKTLATFTGDLSETQIMALGYTKAQAVEMAKMGKIGKAAATEVKTFTQLLSTVKEAVGSGWSTTFRTVIGDFEESKQLFTGISNAVGTFVGKQADARNELLKGWKDMGGRKILIEGLGNVFKGLGSVLKPIAQAFREMFPRKTSAQLLEYTEIFRNFTRTLTVSGGTADKIKRIFLGFFSVFKIAKTVLFGIIGLFGEIDKHFEGLGSSIFSFSARIGDFFVKMNKAVENGALIPFFGAISRFIQEPVKYIEALGEKILKFFGLFDNTQLTATEDSIGKVSYRFQEVGTRVDKLKEVIKNFISALGDMKDKIFEFFGIFDKSNGKLTATEDVVGRVSYRFEEAGTRIDRFKGLWTALMAALSHAPNIIGGIATVFGKVWDYISTWFKELGHRLADVMKPGDFDSAVDVINLGLLGGIAVMLKKFLSGDFLKNLGGGLLSKVTGTLDALTDKLKAMTANIKADTLKKIAISIAILTASLVVLSLIDSAALTKALTAMAVGMGELIGAMAILSQNTSLKGAASVTAIGAGMIALATALLILTGAMKVLATMSWEDIGKGLAAVTGLLTALTVAVNAMGGNAVSVVAVGAAMIPIAVGITILAGAVALFAAMKFGDMMKGLLGLTLSLGIITAMMDAMNPVSILATGIAMIPLATGITILAGAVMIFGKMSWSEMGKGLLGLAGAMLILAVAMNAMPPWLPLIGVGLIAVGIALAEIAGVVALMGQMKLGTMAKGLGALAAMLLILAVGVNAMSGAMLGAAALVVTAGALTILSKVLIELGKLSLKELAIGIGAIAAVLLVLGIAAFVLEPVIPALLGLGIALGLIGVSFALFGLGAMSVAKAFEVMGKSGAAGAKGIVEALKILIAFGPIIFTALAKALVNFVAEILNSAPVLIKGLTVIVGMLLDTIIQLAPKLAEALKVLILNALMLIRETAPAIIGTGLFLLIKLLQGVRDNISQITQLGIDILIRFVDTLNSNSHRIVDAAVNLLISFTQAIANRASDIVTAGINMLISFVEGLTKEVWRIIDAVGTLITTFITESGKKAGDIADAGAEAIVKFIEGIDRNLDKIITAGVRVVLHFLSGLGQNAVELARGAADIIIDFLNGMATAIREKGDELRAAGRNIATAILEGFTGGLSVGDAVKGAVNMAEKVIGGVLHTFGINSPSRVFRDIGEGLIEGLVLGIGDDAVVQKDVVAVAENIVKSFERTLSKVPDHVAGLDEFNPTITPVLDLTKIRSGAKGIDGMMKVSSLTPEVSFTNARHISASTIQQQSEAAEAPVQTGPTEIKFEQNNYSPEALSTNDIYKNTRSQITLAKEELNIPS